MCTDDPPAAGASPERRMLDAKDGHPAETGATSQEDHTLEASANTETSGWDTWPSQTEGPSGHSDGGREVGDEFTDSEGKVVEGFTVYQRGSTRLSVMPATREQRPMIRPEGEKGWSHPLVLHKENTVLGVLCGENFSGFVTLPGEDQMDCWEALVDDWSIGQWRAVHDNVKDRRGQMVGVPHHQGSPNLFQSRRNWAHHNKMEVRELYDLYGMAHTASYKKAKAFSESDLDHPEKFTNISPHNKLVIYNDEGNNTRGEDFNPSQEPLDQELVMIFGGGRPYGSIAMADGLIRCPLTLPEIKARQTSSCPGIRPRPRPVDLAIEAALQKERAATQALLEERDRAAKENTTGFLEEKRARNKAAKRTMYDLLVSMCLQNCQTPPPMPDISGVGRI
ncbi:hypothetical protein ZWY2020_043716 [Hordeum vulgare]|nr:hypothetical protein ZWY2020_043716 [Hordeum vulgare]